tara:strand:- start:55 stop:276 length:222 start_codon:yes stop_codon:yes gene_type:complete
MNDSILLIRDHLIDVCMDLVEPQDGETDDLLEDFTQMADLMLESLSLNVIDTNDVDGKRVFNCQIELVSPNLD